MRSKVFGIGWAKTGTTTLGECLKLLGYDHLSQRLDLVPDIPTGDFSRILATAAGKESFDDWPWIILYRQLDAAFPGSKFVLTVRDEDSWLKSYRGQLARSHAVEAAAGKAGEMLDIRRILYDLPFPDVSDDDLIRRYQRHNAEVMEYFSGRPNDLLRVDWSKGNGWRELCGFLGVPEPGVPFPHANAAVHAAPPRSPPPGAETLKERLRSLFQRSGR